MTERKGYALNTEEGEPFWFLGSLMTLKVAGSQSMGTVSIVEQKAPEGFASALHVHHQDDEVFYVLEGELRVYCGEEHWTLGAGGLAFLPKEVPHAFSVMQGPSRLLQVSAPSGFEDMMRAMGAPATALELPSGPPDMSVLMVEGPKWAHYAEIVGPPPMV
jgi:mannose-6-phosphate isomerase-like protein (cupin superfamily)